MKRLLSLLLFLGILLAPPAPAGGDPFTKAEQLIAQQDYDAARKLLERALRKDPAHADAWTNLGNIRLLQGDPDGAIAAYQKALEVDPLQAIAMNGMGTAYLAKGDKDRAIDWFLKSAQADPKYATPLTNLGDLGMVLQQPAMAIKYYALALEADPTARKPALRLAELHIHAGLAWKSLKWLKPLLERNPDDVEALVLEGRAFMAAPNYLRALEPLLHARELAPDRPDIQRLVGLCCFRTGQWACAEDAYLKALALDDRDPQLFLELGQLYRQSDPANWDKAMEYFGYAASLDPQLPDPWFERGALLEDRDDPKGAEEAYQEAIRRDPTHCGALVNLSRLKALEGDTDAAEGYLEQCLAAEPGFPLALLNRGWMRVESGNCEAALGDLRPLAQRQDPIGEQARELLSACREPTEAPSEPQGATSSEPSTN